MAFVIDLQKESFKFSCSHFTIFDDTHAERLHGHNYYVSLQIWVNELNPQLGMAFDFNSIKPTIRTACDALDECVLIPKNSPFLKIKDVHSQIEVTFAQKHYSLPKEDVCILPLVNITAEELARYICMCVEGDIRQLPSATHIRVTVKETLGQGVSYEHALE